MRDVVHLTNAESCAKAPAYDLLIAGLFDWLFDWGPSKHHVIGGLGTSGSMPLFRLFSRLAGARGRAYCRRMERRRTRWALTLTAGAVLALCGCAIPVRATTPEQTITLDVTPSALSVYGEQAVSIPEEARQPGLTYESVRLFYTVETNSMLEATIRIYVSDDEVPDGSSDGDELVIEETLSAGETITGSAESTRLRSALNAGNAAFVVGGSAESLTGTGTIDITVYAEIRATVSP